MGQYEHITEIERELELELVLSPERSVPVAALLAYRTADPYAVHLTFHIDSVRPIRWSFARDILIDGVFRPSGHGDVRVWPVRAEAGGGPASRSLMLALTSPDGDALLQAPADPVAAWLERTLRVVPPGSEGERLGLDDDLSQLLA
ncbi:SsgA family sporulation/cell division regulator [Streptomyces jietaisiensis]|uniref:SsgA family sporulation/cell division regulator n=1 Tax=Streptomyces griseoaurantiacus TaxID=68213 RepID=UPI00324C973B